MGQIKYDPKPVDIVSLIHQNIELVQSKVDSKNITLSLHLPETLRVLADENMIHTVFRNLLSNAVKFTHQGGEIKIHLNADETTCTLKISDNGVGISKENIEKLFRIDKHVTTPGTENEKGSGLGLILSKEFVERNGGSISVESQLEKGSVFTVTLNLVS
jgi:signal transduction histidine kinase